MKEIEKILKALANRRRLAILKFLKQRGEAPVSEIAGVIKLSFKATSKHLGILSSADIVEKEQRSSQVFYYLAPKQKQVAKLIVDLL